MELEWRRKQDEHMVEIITFSGKITLREIESLNLNAFDRALLYDGGSSKNAEDWLLTLGMLFRRQGSQ